MRRLIALLFALSIPAACAQRDYEAQVDAVIYGKLGTADQAPPERVDRAKKLTLLNVMTSILAYDSQGGADAGKGKQAVTIDPANHSVESAVTFVPAFQIDPNALGQDKGSNLERTRMQFKFHNLGLGEATSVSNNFCTDVNRETKDLHAAVFRSLDIADLYPYESVQRTANAQGIRRPMTAMIHLSGVVWELGENQERTMLQSLSCGASQPDAESGEGLFIMPQCPPNTRRSGTNFRDCFCETGWEGDITLNIEFGAYEGECTKITHFCPLRVDSIDENLRDKDNPELDTSGELGSEALPACSPETDPDTGAVAFYTASVAARCTILNASRGQWVPQPRCTFRPPNVYPSQPACPVADGVGGTFSGCETLAGTQCSVGCQEPLYLPDNDPPITEATCSTSRVDCAQDLTWNGTRCFVRDGPETHKFCCRGVGEAWGTDASGPAKDLVTQSCTAQADELACFVSQEDSSTPCCWKGGACQAGDGDGTADWCAVDLRDVQVAAWTAFPTCRQRCTPPWTGIPRIVISGCERCLPGQSCSDGCSVTCADGRTLWGGGATGARQCDSEASFGAPPACHPPLPPTPNCLAPEEQQFRMVVGCSGCSPGSTDCCNVTCQVGDSAPVSGTAGAKTCQEANTEVSAGSCEAQDTRTACMSHKAGDDLPCCWRAEAEACAAYGSAGIDASEAAPECSVLRRSAFVDLPDCHPLCIPRPLELEPSVDYELEDTQCDSCFAGSPCPACRVNCSDGYLSDEVTPFDLSCDSTREFPVPTCRTPLKQVRNCPTPSGASLEVDGCVNCVPDAGNCACNVICSNDYKLISGDEGGRICEKVSFKCPPPSKLTYSEEQGCRLVATGELYEEPFCCWQVEWLQTGKPPETSVVADCTALTTREACEDSSEGFPNNAEPQRGVACCWRWDMSDANPACVNSESPLLTDSNPARSCSDRTEVFEGIFDKDPPTCAKTCTNTFSREVQHLEFDPAKCADCAAGQPCDCDVQCMSTGKSCTLMEGVNALHELVDWSAIIETTPSFAGCRTTCEDSGTCRVWTWEASSMKCALDSDLARRLSAVTLRSGVVVMNAAERLNPNYWKIEAGYVSGLCSDDGFERTGGGLEGNRACTEENSVLAAPPLCTAVETKQCPQFAVTGYIAGSLNCGAGQCRVDETCECDLTCSEGYRVVMTESGSQTLRCDEKQNSLTTNAACSAIVNKDACLLAEEANEPCCWKDSGFSSGGNCAKRTSTDIGILDEPFQCAAKTTAGWTGIQQMCHKKCDPSLYDSAQFLVLENCDNCIAEGPSECSCQVTCNTTVNTAPMPPPASPEGLKACLAAGDAGPALEPAPTCERICETPSTENGTRLVTNCGNCLPDNPGCPCEVQCAPNTFLSSGVPGPQQCEKTSDGNVFSSAARIQCTPQCELPSDAFATREIQGCGNCAAGTPFEDCQCAITCIGVQTGGGPVGDYVCVEYTVAGNRLARWEPRSPSDSPREEPICSSPVQVTVLDASNNARIEGVLVQLFRESDNNLDDVRDEQTTDARGVAELTTNLQRLLVRVSKEGFSDQVTVIDRLRECADNPRECSARLFMSANLGGTALVPDGCYLSFKNDTRWAMRTVLSWSNPDADLDHYARPFSRVHEILAEWGCAEGQDQAQCQRNDFFRKSSESDPTYVYRDVSSVLHSFPNPNCDPDKRLCQKQTVVDYEVKAGVYYLVKVPQDKVTEVCTNQQQLAFCSDQTRRDAVNFRWGRATATWTGDTHTLTFDDATQEEIPSAGLEAHPYPDPFPDRPFVQQFSKWTTWESSFTDNIQQSVVNGIVQDRPGLGQWPKDNYLNLDVDSNSLGPETITYQSPPPGLYQVAVGDYNYDQSLGDWVRLDLHIGDDATFECRVSDACGFESPIWNVVNINFQDEGDELVIPSLAADAVNFQEGSILVVESASFSVKPGMELVKGMRGVVQELSATQIVIDFEAPVPPKQVSWAAAGSSQRETITLFEAKRSLRVLMPTGNKAFSLNLLDTADTMQVLRDVDMPTQRWAYTDWYYPIMMPNTITAAQWRDVCYGECRLAGGLQPAFEGCLERRNEVRNSWVNRFDWYPRVRFHGSVKGLSTCDSGAPPDEAGCLNAGGYVIQRLGGQVTGSLEAGEWADRAPGCSINDQTGNAGSWRVQFNRNSNGVNGGNDIRVCSGAGF